jgi:hypothetical protein
MHSSAAVGVVGVAWAPSHAYCLSVFLLLSECRTAKGYKVVPQGDEFGGLLDGDED